MIKRFPEAKKIDEEKLATMREELVNVDDELSKLPNESNDVLKQKKIDLDAEIETIGTIAARAFGLKDNIGKRDQAIKDYEELTRSVEKLRDKKKELIANASLGVKGISIEEDHVKLDGFEFKENQISKSKAITIIARLMCAINQSPIQVIGSANDLDWEVLDELDALARDQGKIMILDQVDRDSTDIAVIGYEPKGSLTTDKIGPPTSDPGTKSSVPPDEPEIPAL
jgi:hypothetical protein